MIQTRLIAPSLLALAISSCAPSKPIQSGTASPYAAADASTAVNAPATPAPNPVYDTPAAYEESSASITPANGSAATTPNIPVTPSYAATPANAAPAAAPTTRPNTSGAAIIHTVVAGDTLSGISAKYKVSTTAIKQANGMTKDTVVLGRKMAIPPQ